MVCLPQTADHPDACAKVWRLLEGCSWSPVVSLLGSLLKPPRPRCPPAAHLQAVKGGWGLRADSRTLQASHAAELAAKIARVATDPSFASKAAAVGAILKAHPRRVRRGRTARAGRCPFWQWRSSEAWPQGAEQPPALPTPLACGIEPSH